MGILHRINNPNSRNKQGNCAKLIKLHIPYLLMELVLVELGSDTLLECRFQRQFSGIRGIIVILSFYHNLFYRNTSGLILAEKNKVMFSLSFVGAALSDTV